MMLKDEERNHVYGLIKSRNMCLDLEKDLFNECYDKVLDALGDQRGTTLDSEQLVSMIAAHYNAYKHALYYLQKRDRVYELYKANSCGTEVLDKEAFTEYFNEVILAGQQSSSSEKERHPETMVLDVETQELANRHVVGKPTSTASVSSSSSKQNNDKVKKAEEQDHDEDDQQPEAKKRKKKKLILRKLNLRNNSTKWVVHSEDIGL